MTLKSCSKCKELKSTDLFQIDKSRKDGLQTYCKQCRKTHQRNYYVSNKEKFDKKQKLNRDSNKESINESARNRYQLNKEKESERKKIYYLNNKKKIDERNKNYNKINKRKRQKRERIYYLENKESISEKSKIYIKNNPERNRNASAKRRVRQMQNGVYLITSKELKNLYSANCFYCGFNKNIEIDHIVPISRGGSHSIGNLISACMTCNRSKNNKYLVEWKALKNDQ
jgi:5-methylcytosine-specific restriction endonuclease McrA